MPGIKDLSIVNSNTAKATPAESGTEAVLCSPELCGSKNLTVCKRTISQGKKFDLPICRLAIITTWYMS